MFNVGGMELLVIGLVALVVLGPDKLPGAMRQVGSVMGELRRMSKGFQVDLRAALDEAERDAERGAQTSARAAAATDPEAGTVPDPGAAAAAAQAELAALEQADSASEPPAGTEGKDVSGDRGDV